MHYHFNRDKILLGEIDFVHINIENYVANIFTKALSIDKLWKFRNMFSVLKLWTWTWRGILKIQIQLIQSKNMVKYAKKVVPHVIIVTFMA
jgi:hypothetical protein